MDEEYPLMAFIANIGVAPKGDRYDRSALVHDEKGKKYKRTEKGDFIYSSNNLETGSIGLNNYGNACISPVYSIFKSKHTVDPEFMGRILLRKEFINQMVSFRQGVVYGQWKIHEDDFLNLDILVPQTTEQQKIGGFFSELDKIITLHQRECFSFDFSGESAKTAQKTISWEQRKFSELTEIRSASRVHKDEWQSSGVPFYRSSDVMAALNGTENEKAFISEELYEKLSAVSGKLEKGDVLVTGGGSVGKPYIVPNNEPLYTKDADLLWIKNNENLDPYFVYTFFFSPTFTDYLNSVSHVGTIAHYTITQLGETPITLPCVSEQQKIGDYFRNLDFLITLHQHKPNKKGHDVLSVMPFKGNQRKPHYLCT